MSGWLPDLGEWNSYAFLEACHDGFWRFRGSRGGAASQHGQIAPLRLRGREMRLCQCSPALVHAYAFFLGPHDPAYPSFVHLLSTHFSPSMPSRGLGSTAFTLLPSACRRTFVCLLSIILRVFLKGFLIQLHTTNSSGHVFLNT